MFLLFVLVFACILWPEATSFSFWIVVSLVVMAFQGAGQAQQLSPAAVSPVPVFTFLEKSFVDFYPTYDKTYVTKKKENKMGLDQYAHLRGQEYEWDAKDDNQFYWRKHARLQQFMAKEHAKQNPVEKNENDMGLGFNGGPVFITEEVVRKLEEAIENDYFDYFAPDGFFWGQQFQEQQVKEYKAQDKKFLQWCKDMIAKKKVVEYHCSW